MEPELSKLSSRRFSALPMVATDLIDRFTSRVQNYAEYRPDYPPSLLSILRAHCHLTPYAAIADVGSGTGLLTQLFLKHGNSVYAIEPNPAMRQTAENKLAHHANFYSVAGQAEATTLPPRSVSLIAAGQAFHWFDPAATRQEFQRILRPGGWVALIWNDRCRDTPFLAAYERLLQRYGTDYAEVTHRRAQMDVLDQFYGAAGYTTVALRHRQVFDYDGLEGRLLSSSYTPEPGHPCYPDMLKMLADVFRRYSADGQVAFDYSTRMHYGQLT